jgi:hypothetical protein
MSNGLRRWKISSDGALWGGILTVVSVASLLAVLALAVTDRL